MRLLTRIASVGLLLVGTSASAEYIKFSQYDGRNTWNNFRVDVADALSYKQPGSIYVEGRNRSPIASTPPTDEVVWTSERVIYTLQTMLGSTKTTYYRSSPNATFLDRKDAVYYPAFVSPLYNAEVTDPTESENAQGDVMRHSGTAAAPATSGTPGRDRDRRPTHLIVPVPTGVVMEEFIYNYMNFQNEE